MSRDAPAETIAAAIGALAGAVFWASFNTVARVVASVWRLWERWKTWQGASPDQRARWGDDRHDVWPTDRESAK